jgi:hypothetical protein
MFDYPAIRKFYFDKGAEKCASDPSGNGRFESAFYHTIKMVHDTVSAENAERIAVLEADNKTLRAALATTGAGNAQLLAENAKLQEIVAGEINHGRISQRDAMADLKDYVSAERIHDKIVAMNPTGRVEFIHATGHANPIKIQDGDRRFFVSRADLKADGVEDTKEPE